MTQPTPSQHVRNMLQILDESQQQTQLLNEARPYGFMQQLRQMVQSPFRPSANMQLSVQTYANNIYTSWQQQSAVIEKTSGQAPTARDFVTWYGTSPTQGGRADPVSTAVISRLIQQARLDMNAPIPEAQLGPLCQKIAGAVVAQTAKVSMRLVNKATPQQEQKVLEILEKMDDVLLQTEPRLTLKLIHTYIERILTADVKDPEPIKDAITLGWARFAQMYRRTGGSINPFKPTNALRLTADEKTNLVDVLPDLLLTILMEIDLRAAVKEPTNTASGATTSAPAPTTLSAADYAAKYTEWQTQLAPVGVSADEIKRIVDKIFGITP